MTRLCVLVALLAGCSTTSTTSVPASAPGERRFSSAQTGKPLMHAGKARHKRRPLSVSRDLRRQALENRHNWTAVAACESSGDWQANTGNGYYGGLQADLAFWANYGGLSFAARPDLASEAEQITVAERGLAVQGAGAWPTCGWRLAS